MRLSTSSIHYLHLPIEQACERIAKLGFEAVDIWSAHQGCPHLDDVAKRLGADGLRKVLDQQKLKLFAFSVYAGGYARYAQLLGESGGGVAVPVSRPGVTYDAFVGTARQVENTLPAGAHWDGRDGDDAAAASCRHRSPWESPDMRGIFLQCRSR